MKTKMRTLMDRVAEMCTCGHAGYGYLALAYAAGCLHVADKALVEQAVLAVYLALALRR